jgi:hypothetical protein
MKLLQKLFNFTTAPTQPESTTDQAPQFFFLLECWNQYADLPESLLPFVDTIKTKEEWEKLGFVLEFNKYGQVRKFKVANRYFSFIPVSQSHPVENEAIRTGKRLTYSAEQIRLLLKRGCLPSEFLNYEKSLSLHV